MKRIGTRAWLPGVAALFASAVLASGHLPPRTQPPQSFASFDACVEHLRQLYAQDMTGAKQGPQPIENGATREKTVETQGVVANGPDEAHYNAEVGWSIRVPGGDAVGHRWIRTSYTFERWAWTCSSALLTGTMNGGFASPSFKPISHASEQ